MKRGLIVKGRRYYSPKFDEYVTAVKRHDHFVTFRRNNGDVVRILPKNVFYVSVDDYNLCDELATEAKMSWFFPWFDNATGTEINWEEADKNSARSFRNAVRGLSEGLIDENFKFLPDPKDCCRRFRAILCGMGLHDPGDYLTMFE